MMKVFISGSWWSKVNFVDENNVCLGYDLSQNCCENADWFISDKVETKIIKRTEDAPDLNGFVFDCDFFQKIEGDEFEDGGMAVFRIKSKTAEKFIHIYNAQNGYYSHGFNLKVSGEVLREGEI